MPDVYPSYSPAQMGNLNKDSTHPNPWYPPTEMERFHGISLPYRIFHNPRNPIGPLEKGPNFLEDDPFLDNCRHAAVLGLKVGTVVALNDIVNVNAIDATRARFARFCFIVPPYPAMTVSFVCAREVFANISKEKDALWTYPAAALAPATVWGIFKNNFQSGFRFAALWGFFAAAWKFNTDTGFVFDPFKSSLNPTGYTWVMDHNHETGIHRDKHIGVEGWKGWPMQIDSVKTWWTPTEEPAWKKHVSPEEAEKGPPTNF